MTPLITPRRSRRVLGLACSALAAGALAITPVAAQAAPSPSTLKDRTTNVQKVEPQFFCNIYPSLPFICKGKYK